MERRVAQPSTTEKDDLALLRSSVRLWLDREPDLTGAGHMGLLGLLTHEENGGSGWRLLEACVVAEEFGRALSPLSWTPNLVAAGALSADLSQGDLLASVLDGVVKVALIREGDENLIRDGGRLHGTIEVLGSSPDVVLLLDLEWGVRVVDCRSAAVGFTATTTSMDSLRPTGHLTLRSARTDRVEGADALLLSDAATLLACADSLGALASVAEQVRVHLNDRQAFGRPLASFQELQHRLADLAVLEAAVAALVRQGTQTVSPERDARSRRSVVAAVHSYVARHVTAALDDCIQLAGGIGFTWEFPAHHAMRRSLANSCSVRTPQVSLCRLEVPVLANDRDGDADPFRARARDIIRSQVPFEVREGHRAPNSHDEELALRSWYRTLFEHNLLGGSWPLEWGGDPHYHPLHELVVTEELIAARAPRPIDQVQLASHVLIRFGTNTQKARYLPRIRSAEDIWCQLFSEPDCGSDLAGVKARAEQLDDGRWRITGQKTWTTDAHWAQMGLALLRTGAGDRRHDGLTVFLVPMNTQGVTVQPKLTIGSAYEFNDVFLDEVLLAQEHVLGTVGQGWAVAMSGLELERFAVGGNVLLLDLLLADLSKVATAVFPDHRSASGSNSVRSDLAALASDAYAARAFVTDHVEQALNGEEQPGDAAIAKLLYSETYNRIARHGAELISEHSPPPEHVKEPARRLMDGWLWSRALTISGGSSEVMRNIIARRRLRLPE